MVNKGKAVLGERPMAKGETSDLPFTPIRQETLPRKLELPIFEGNNPDGWLIRAKRYFEINGVVPTDRLQAAMVCVEGDALAWYYYEESRKTIRDGRNLRNHYWNVFVHHRWGI